MKRISRDAGGRKRGRWGFTLVELLVAMGLAAVIGTAVAVALVGAGSRAQEAHEAFGRVELARMSVEALGRELRWAREITSLQAASIEFVDGDGVATRYAYEDEDHTLRRTRGGDEEVLARGIHGLELAAVDAWLGMGGEACVSELEMRVACAPGPEEWRVMTIHLVNSPRCAGVIVH